MIQLFYYIILLNNSFKFLFKWRFGCFGYGIGIAFLTVDNIVRFLHYPLFCATHKSVGLIIISVVTQGLLLEAFFVLFELITVNCVNYFAFTHAIIVVVLCSNMVLLIKFRCADQLN